MAGLEAGLARYTGGTRSGTRGRGGAIIAARPRPTAAATSAPTAAGGHQITINIGGAGADSSATPAAASPDWYAAWQQRQGADVADQRAQAQVPAMLQQDQPVLLLEA